MYSLKINFSDVCKCEDEIIEENTVDGDLGGSKRGKQTGKLIYL